MPLPGSATLEGTTRYRERFKDAASNHFRRQRDLLLSSLGIGTYLGNADEATDARYTAAVTRAAQLGANVIDTAANYRFQRSERSIGAALESLIGSEGFAREELFICTKGGYCLLTVRRRVTYGATWRKRSSNPELPALKILLAAVIA